MCKNTIYSRLVRSGATLDHHESDLYVLVYGINIRELLTVAKSEGHAVTYFTDDAGARWADIPFAYDPWWERRGKDLYETLKSRFN